MFSTTYYYLQTETRTIFYVGRCYSHLIEKRLAQHIGQAKKGTTNKDLFIQQHLYKIQIIPFETVTHKKHCSHVPYREKYWIQTLQQIGHVLLNNTLSWMSKYNFQNRLFSDKHRNWIAFQPFEHLLQK